MTEIEVSSESFEASEEEDFASKTNKHSQQPPLSSPETCVICFEPMANTGEHKLAALACGHVFGFVCVEKWVTDRQRCPQCAKKQLRKNIVPLFVNSLLVKDASREVQYLARAKKEEALRRTALRKLRAKERAFEDLQTKYRSVRDKYLALVGGAPGSQSSTEESLVSFKAMLLVEDARVLALPPAGLPQEGLFAVANQKSLVSLFEPERESPLRVFCGQPENAVVKDMAWCVAQPELLLCAGFGRTAALCSLDSGFSVLETSCVAPAWSAAFSAADPFVFFIGSSNGRIEEFDMRNLLGPIGSRVCTDSNKPVHSLAPLSDGALLASTFDKVVLFAADGPTEPFPVLSAGSVDCLRVENNLCVLTTRQTSRYNSLCKLFTFSKRNSKWIFEEIFTLSSDFVHRNFLSKSGLGCFTDKSLVAVADEESKQVLLFENGKESARLLKNTSPVVDVQFARDKLYSLSTDRLDIYNINVY